MDLRSQTSFPIPAFIAPLWIPSASVESTGDLLSGAVYIPALVTFCAFPQGPLSSFSGLCPFKSYLTLICDIRIFAHLILSDFSGLHCVFYQLAICSIVSCDQ